MNALDHCITVTNSVGSLGRPLNRSHGLLSRHLITVGVYDMTSGPCLARTRYKYTSSGLAVPPDVLRIRAYQLPYS
jgi:hypothetical protein